MLWTQAAAVSSPSPPLLGSSRRSPRTHRGGRRGGGGGGGGGADEGGGGWGGLCWRKRPPVDSAPHRWGPAEDTEGRVNDAFRRSGTNSASPPEEQGEVKEKMCLWLLAI